MLGSLQFCLLHAELVSMHNKRLAYHNTYVVKK